MMYHNIDYGAVLVAMVVSVVIGMIWYADPVFGRVWKRLHGLSAPHKPTAAAFAIWAVGAYIMAYTVFRVLVMRMNVTSMGDALLTGVLLAVGLVVAGAAPGYAMARKPLALAAIEMGYVVLSILVMSAIAVAW